MVAESHVLARQRVPARDMVEQRRRPKGVPRRVRKGATIPGCSPCRIPLPLRIDSVRVDERLMGLPREGTQDTVDQREARGRGGDPERECQYRHDGESGAPPPSTQCVTKITGVTSTVFGLLPTDAVDYVIAAALIASGGVLAALLPAFRAGRIGPLITLRTE